jgi:hypothetical protein
MHKYFNANFQKLQVGKHKERKKETDREPVRRISNAFVAIYSAAESNLFVTKLTVALFRVVCSHIPHTIRKEALTPLKK